MTLAPPRNQSGNSSSGFTLLEVLIAVLILAAALVTLLGLETSVIQRSIRDRNKRYAMLYARSILAALETSSDPIPTQDRTTTLDQLMNTIVKPPQMHLAEPEAIREFNANLKVEPWQWMSPDGKKPIDMKRIHLSISWSPDPADSFDITYFVPPDEKEDSTTVEPPDE